MNYSSCRVMKHTFQEFEPVISQVSDAGTHSLGVCRQPEVYSFDVNGSQFKMKVSLCVKVIQYSKWAVKVRHGAGC